MAEKQTVSALCEFQGENLNAIALYGCSYLVIRAEFWPYYAVSGCVPVGLHAVSLIER